MNDEIEKIMNGEREMRGLRIEGDTIGFDTEKHGNWNFQPRDIEYIIYNLQRENKKLRIEISARETVNEKAIEYIETCNDKEKLESMFLDESYISNYGAKELLNILKGSDEE